MKIKRGKMVIVLNILCLIILIGTLIFLAAIWSEIPDKIPMHYGLDGTIDRWGQKTEIFIMPFVTWGMYIFLTIIENVPKVWNIGVKVTEENKERIYLCTLQLICTIKFILVCIFTYLTVQIATAGGLPVWFLPVVVVAIFGDLIYWSWRLLKLK